VSALAVQAPTRRLVVDGRSVTVVRGPIVSGEGGVSVHGALSGRAAADSHPLAAVTGLADALAGKAAGGEVVAAFMTHPGTLPAGAPWAGQTVLVAGVGTDAGLYTIDAGGALTQIAGAPDLAPGQWAVEVVDPLGDPRGPAVFVAFDLTGFGGLAGVSEITIDPTVGPLGAALAAKADAVHEHVAADVTDLDAVVGAAVADAVAAASARVAVLPSDVSAVSTTTLTDVSGLAVALEASSRYLVHVRGVCGGDVSADLSVALAGPAGASAVGVTLLAPTTAAANSPFTASTGTGVVTPGLGTALTVGVAGTAGGTKRRVHFELSAVVTTTTAGNLRVQMAQAVSTATEVTIFAGSVLRAEKVV
jgi:hypothetical protein